MKTFNDYAATPAGKAVLGAEFTDRLEKTSFIIATLKELKEFTRDRWPSDFPHNWREPSPPNAKHGREAVARWSGAYLQWAESDAEVEP